MPRNTRAAARADGDTTSNASQTSETTVEPAKSTQVKAGKSKRGKAKKGKNSIAVEDATAQEAVAEETPLGGNIGQRMEAPGSTPVFEPMVMAAPEEQPIPPSPLRRSTRRKGQEPVVPTEIEAEPQIALTISSDQLASSPEPELDSPLESKDLPQAKSDGSGQGHVDSAHTPDAIQELQSIFQRSAEADDAEDDSAISEIINKTPAKPTPSPRSKTREDPIEALDALEDALDEVGEFLPSAVKASKKAAPAPALKRQLSAKVTSPATANAHGLSTKARDKTNAAVPGNVPTTRRQASTTAVVAKPSRPAQTRTSAKVTAERTSVAPRQAVLSKSSTTNSHPSSIQNLISPKVSPGQTITMTSSRVVSDVKKRTTIAALQTPPPAVKSTKPLTKPVFQLPGEILAAKLKAQREERIKRQEAAAASAAENKVRLVSKPTATEVRQMAASAARKSILTERNKNSDDGARGTLTSTTKRPLSMAPRASSFAPRLSIASSRPKSMLLSASTGVPSTETRPRPTSIHGSQALSSTMQPRAAAPGSTAGRAPVRTTSVSGKEVANRAKLEQKSREQEMKDKAEAARKARAEAAERGRQASKEWAEKMMKKSKAAAAAAAAATSADAPAAIAV